MKFDSFIDNHKEEIIHSTQEILKIKSVEEEALKGMPFGEGVHQSLIYTLDLCDHLGFKTKNVDNYAGYAEIGEGEDMIGILVHLDVVPEGENWDYDPYSAIIADNKIYGRGAIDDKGPAVSAIYAMKALLDSGEKLNKRVRIIFGLNEESGWKSISYYMDHEEVPTMAFTPDAEFPAIHGEKGILQLKFEKAFSDKVNDGGIVVQSIKGGNRPNMVPDHAEAKLLDCKNFDHILEAYNQEKGGQLSFSTENDVTTITSLGTSAHGSTPEAGVNAISHLLSFLSHLDLQVGDAANFIRFYARFIGLEHNGQSIGCGLEDEVSGKLSFNVGIVNFDENNGSIDVDVRYPVTHGKEDVFNGIQEYMEIGKLTLKESDHMPPIYVPKDHQLIQSLMEVYRDYTGDVSDPITIGGGTYARSMKNAVAFGAVFPGKPELAHQRNEFIDIDDLILMTKIFASGIYKLAK